MIEGRPYGTSVPFPITLPIHYTAADSSSRWHDFVDSTAHHTDDKFVTAEDGEIPPSA